MTLKRGSNMKKKNKREPEEIRRSAVNPTTNYPMDHHKFFCKRCFAYHTVCPKTGKKPTDACTL